MQSPYLVENRHIAIKRCRHGLFMYNRHDAFVGRGLDLYGEWCDFEIQQLRTFIKPGDTVIDVGANIGTHTVAFANLVGPTGKVHAFEPQPRLFSMLAGNVALNALEWVVCHQKGVGEKMGEVELAPLPPRDPYFNYSSVKLETGDEGGQKVPLVNLDSLGLTSCAVVKIDVEGMEALVLKGALRLIKQCQPILYVEDNGPQSSDPVAEILEKIKYNAYWSTHPYFNENNFYDNPLNVWGDIVWSSNLICIPEKIKVDLHPAQKYLGKGDSWRAFLQRMRDQQ